MTNTAVEQRALIDRVLAGDSAAFRDLVNAYQRLVGRIVFRMVHAREDREDICQDVFLKVYRNLSRFRGESSLSTWIGRIAYNTSLSYLDKKKVPLYEDLVPEGETVDSRPAEAPAPDEIVEAGLVGDRLQAEIDSLPPAYRTIITLYHKEELSYTEIGKITNMPEGTVKSHLFRARKMLKERLLSKYAREELWS